MTDIMSNDPRRRVKMTRNQASHQAWPSDPVCRLLRPMFELFFIIMTCFEWKKNILPYCLSAGDHGEPGDLGPMGPPGPHGMKGAHGQPGTPGRDGKDGRPGKQCVYLENTPEWSCLKYTPMMGCPI